MTLQIKKFNSWAMDIKRVTKKRVSELEDRKLSNLNNREREKGKNLGLRVL